MTKRWDAQLDAVSWVLRYDNGFFADNARIGLARFAHDPATNMARGASAAGCGTSSHIVQVIASTVR